MLQATEQEIATVRDYIQSQAPDLTVTFLQKVYVENIGSHPHAVWDVHTDKDRWWVITNPSNLYSQQQFPNMDLALTFHVGLCLRVPRSERQKISDLPAEPFMECFRQLREMSDALGSASEVADYQALGVRGREVLLALVSIGQDAIPWTGTSPAPKRADFRAWADHFCDQALGGPAQEDRRHLLKATLSAAWKFTNWLTHAKASTWYDAEAAETTVEHVVGLMTSALIRRIRGVPETCPACGSHHLAPERGSHSELEGVVFEQATCPKCGWTGSPVPMVIPDDFEFDENEGRPPPDGECAIMETPLTEIRRP